MSKRGKMEVPFEVEKNQEEQGARNKKLKTVPVYGVQEAAKPIIDAVVSASESVEAKEVNTEGRSGTSVAKKSSNAEKQKKGKISVQKSMKGFLLKRPKPSEKKSAKSSSSSSSSKSAKNSSSSSSAKPAKSSPSSSSSNSALEKATVAMDLTAEISEAPLASSSSTAGSSASQKSKSRKFLESWRSKGLKQGEKPREWLKCLDDGEKMMCTLCAKYKSSIPFQHQTSGWVAGGVSRMQWGTFKHRGTAACYVECKKS